MTVIFEAGHGILVEPHDSEIPTLSIAQIGLPVVIDHGDLV